MDKGIAILYILMLVVEMFFTTSVSTAEDSFGYKDRLYYTDKNGNKQKTPGHERKYYTYGSNLKGTEDPEYQKIQRQYEEDMRKIMVDSKYDGMKNSVGDKSEYDSILHKQDVVRGLQYR